MRGDVVVRFSLASGAPAALQLLDPAGRRLHAEPIPSPSAGPGAIRVRPGRPIAPGVYWLRLVQGGRSAASKVVRVR